MDKGNIMQKQALLLLKNKSYAYFLTIILALIPFASWLSLSVAALVTLRKGGYEGFKILMVSLTATLVIGVSNQPVFLPFEIPAMIGTAVAAYLLAFGLRAALGLKVLLAALVASALIGIAMIHWLWPESISLQSNALMHLLQKALPEGQKLKLFFTVNHINTQTFANYLLGIQMLSVILSALSSVMMARYVQSRVFYPGGFRKELLSFQADRLGVVVLFLSIIGVYYHYPLAISVLPVLLVYVMVAGMLVLFKLMAKKKDWLAMLFLFIPLILAPYVMLPVYVLFGSLDSWFNFKQNLAIRGE